MSYIHTFESFINEGGVKAFEMGMEEMITKIETGMGWIDPEYVEDTYLAMQKEDGDFFGIPFNGVKDEIFKRLIAADLLYNSGNNPDTKGKKVTNVSQI